MFAVGYNTVEVIIMLKCFSVRGFKNFSKEIVLDFSNVHDYKFNTECISNGLVGKSIVYGKNSVGKTNLGLALFDIVSHLTNKNVTPSLYDYYLCSFDETLFAEFRYIFQFGEDTVDYSYRKDKKQNLIFESVVINSKLLYEYDYRAKQGLLGNLEKIAPTLNWRYTDSECILKYFINNSILDENDPLRRLYDFVSNMLWFRTLDENRYIGYKTDSKDYFEFIFESNSIKEFEELLKVTGIKEGLVVKKDADGENRLYFDTKSPLPFFKVASSGTRALYTFFYWYKTAKDVSFMYVDEFDAYYHYELSEYIVDILKKMKNTQIIITSHNTNLFSNKIMRPDCYFVLTNNKLTSVADATGRELREGHNLEKLYISGEFDE